MRILLLITVTCLLLCSCFSGTENKTVTVQEIPISNNAAGRNYSLHLSSNRLYMIYPSTAALSLTLVTAEISGRPQHPLVGEPTHLDRISYSPDIEPNFGRHLFLADDRLRHILYIDRESEESSVLKWLSKSDVDDTWWIDAFQGVQEPLLAVAEDDGALQALVIRNGIASFYRFSREGQPQQLSTASLASSRFEAQGDISVVEWENYTALTVFDAYTSRLYLIKPRDNEITSEAIYSTGGVHFATILENHLLVLVFEPAESTITLLSRKLPSPKGTDPRPFEVLPVTRCEGTTSVFLADHAGKRLYLFNERTYDKTDKGMYTLSLLYPHASDSKYEKTTVVEGDVRIDDFKALKAGDFLYVLLRRQDRLMLLSVSLADL